MVKEIMQPVRVNISNIQLLDKISAKTGLSRTTVLNLIIHNFNPKDFSISASWRK